MKWTLYLGRIAGIKLFMHWTFIILIGWIFLTYFRMGNSMQDALMGVLFILTIFGCVILHELGHALTARKFNIGTKRITILPIGGVASIERMPEKPGQELWVAIMGPVVNVIIACLLYLFLSASDGIPSMQELIDLQESQTSLSVNDYFLFNPVLLWLLFMVMKA